MSFNKLCHIMKTYEEAIDIFNIQVKWYKGSIYRAYRSLSEEVKSILAEADFDIYGKDARKLYELKCRRLTEINAVGIENYEKRKWQEWDLDHIVSISFGFEFNIPYELIASRDNLRVISHIENYKKGSKLTSDGAELLKKWGYEVRLEHFEYDGFKRKK